MTFDLEVLKFIYECDPSTFEVKNKVSD